MFNIENCTLDELYEAANKPRLHWWLSGCGRVELVIQETDARDCSHPGPCDDDVNALLSARYIQIQMEKFTDEQIRDALVGYSDWDLSNRDANKQRILWIACGDIVENLSY